jgi:hypothetical protein
MNGADYRLAGEIGRHLIAIGKELLRWRDSQPGVMSHQHDEPADIQPPRPPSAHGGQRRERNGSSFR